MSGIVGIFHRDGAPVDRAVLGRMTDAMIRRGPDAQRIWTDGPVGFGHAALFTTLEAERENQPATLDGQVWITADARIDEWVNLRQKLEAKGRDLGAAVTDVELILHAYHVWGEDCVDHLIGDFSFVIWDARQQTLFCARDHMGVKPFYYYLSDTLFVFASEVRALLAMPDVPRRINEARIADYLIMELEGIDKISTFFCDIFRLPPANTLSVTLENARIDEYWHLELPDPLRLKSDAEYLEAFNEYYANAIVRRLRAPSPNKVGAMLSGGIDSASIVAIAREHFNATYGTAFNVFSAISDDGNDLETRCNRAIVAQGGVASFIVRPHEIDQYARDLAYILLNNTSLFDTWMEIPHLMNVVAKHRGVRILLSGIGGDEIMSLGENYIADLLRKGKWITAIREARGTADFYRDFGDRPWKTLFSQARTAFVPRDLLPLGIYNRRKNKYVSKLINVSLIHPEFAKQVDVAERFEKLNMRLGTKGRATTAQNRVSFLNRAYVAVANERYDSVAAAHGVEARHPLWDKQFVEFCMSLPWDQRVRGGWTKYILRRSMNSRLPKLVCWRKGRSSLSPEFISARNRLEKERVVEIFADEPDSVSYYVKQSELSSALNDLIENNEIDLRNSVWYGFTLALWLRKSTTR